MNSEQMKDQAKLQQVLDSPEVQHQRLKRSEADKNERCELCDEAEPEINQIWSREDGATALRSIA